MSEPEPAQADEHSGIPTKPTPEARAQLERECTVHAVSHLLSELLFTLLPFVVLALVFLKGRTDFRELFSEAEWSFASVILFGQTSVRLVTGAGASANDGRPMRAENVGFLISCLTVLGVVPSMAVMVMILVAPPAPTWLVAAQMTLFVLAAATFLLVGIAVKSHELQFNEEFRRGWRVRR